MMLRGTIWKDGKPMSDGDQIRFQAPVHKCVCRVPLLPVEFGDRAKPPFGTILPVMQIGEGGSEMDTPNFRMDKGKCVSVT